MAFPKGHFILHRPVSAKYSAVDQIRPATSHEDVDAEEEALNTPSRSKDSGSVFTKFYGWKRCKSWRLLVESGALTAVIVFLINLSALVVAYSRFRVEDHVANVWTGNCDRAAAIVTASHLVINVLSSLLLAASNASMQCLGSPSREEVDAGHRKRQAFAIGIPSFRNVLQVSISKRLLWFLLASSSLPLHLFWNSTVFQTLSANNYYAFSVAENFTQGADWYKFQKGVDSWMLDGLWETTLDMQKLAQNSSLQRLDRSDCIAAYGQELVVDRRNLLMIVNTSSVTREYYQSPSSLIALYASAFTPNATTASSQDGPTYSWMCSQGSSSCDPSTLSRLKNDESIPWIPGYNTQREISILGCGAFGNNGAIACGDQDNAEVLYCLSEHVEGQCKVGLIPLFLIIVCVCNVIKIIAFISTLYLIRKRRSIITQGDAVESFLDAPDNLLRNKCLATRYDFVNVDTIFSKDWDDQRQTIISDVGRKVKSDKSSKDTASDGVSRRWWKAASGGRWFSTYILVLAFFIATAKLFTHVPWSPAYPQLSQSAVWEMFRSQGLGKPLPTFTKNYGDMPIVLAFFAANIPQLVLSYLYIMVNILLTSMLGMAEWTSYYAAPVAKGLRVSNPITGSKQTSSHFLTLPFRWGLPTLVIFMLLHWLSSQMLFAAKIETYNFDGRLNMNTSVTGVYYSPLVTICVVCLGGAAMIVLLLIANIKHFPAGAPLAGNCSASIAAACQPPVGEREFEPDLAQKKLRWGVVDVPYSETEVGHATFSDGHVGRLVPGMIYA